MNKRQLNILRHALGYDDAGNDLWNGAPMDQRRNRFVTGQGSSDWDDCQYLCAAGLMFDHGPQQLAGGDHCFTVTEDGITEVMNNRPPPLSRSKERYQQFLRADCGLKFGEWLKRHYTH